MNQKKFNNIEKSIYYARACAQARARRDARMHTRHPEPSLRHPGGSQDPVNQRAMDPGLGHSRMTNGVARPTDLSPVALAKGDSTGLTNRVKSFVIGLLVVGFLSMMIVATADAANRKRKKKKFNAEHALSSQKFEDRMKAARRIKRKKDFVSPAKIKEALAQETNPLIKVRLQEALTSLSDSAPEVQLMESLKNDPNGMVRTSAAQKLGNYTHTRMVVKTLADALDNDTDVSVKYAAALSLSLSKDPKAINVLVKHAKSEDPNLRRQIAYSLKSHAKKKRVKKVLRKLKKDKDKSVRMAAGATK